MKEFVNKIQIAPAADIDSISGTTITMKSGKTIDVLFPIGDIKPEETDDKKNGMRYYQQTLKVISEKLTSTLYNRYRDRKVVVKLFDDQDTEYLLGNLEYPARCSDRPELDQDIMTITCDNPNPLVS